MTQGRRTIQAVLMTIVAVAAALTLVVPPQATGATWNGASVRICDASALSDRLEEVASCCGEGCTCTPESCPCADPAPADHDPRAPLPAPVRPIRFDFTSLPPAAHPPVTFGDAWCHPWAVVIRAEATSHGRSGGRAILRQTGVLRT